MNKHKILKIAPVDAALRDRIAGDLGISKVLSQILINRGLDNIQEIDHFLNVKINNFLDPFMFSDMSKAKEVILKAKEDKKKVFVFGDYDADGITALALIKGTFDKMGLRTEHYLPHRIKDGYGLNRNVVKLARESGVDVLLTADCGINNHKEVEELRKSGIEVIITDHHEQLSDDLPMASAVINPKARNSGYKYRDLAGVGVAYKLCQALTGSLLLDELDLVSLGTIADSVPLTGENRIIVREGLAKLQETSRPGLRAIIDNTGIRNKKLNSTYVSFIIGPRINASGRVDTAEISLKLLMTHNQEEASDLAKLVEMYNRQRQKIENKILEEAQDIINREINFKEHKVIVIAKEDWHKGVLGIVASRIADKFYRPAIVISLDEELCKGSARSIKNFHLFNALVECKEFLNNFGGHSHAAGLVITRDSIDDFKQNINRLAHERMTLEDLMPVLDIDMEMQLSQLDAQVVAEFDRLEPFGTGNPEPMFFSRNLKLKGAPQTLSRETLKFWLTDGNLTYPAIGFGMSGFKESLLKAGSFDLVYTPRIDTWQGDNSVILEIKDIFFR